MVVILGGGEITQGRVSKLSRSRRNSNLQLALAVKRERHDAFGSNLPIVKPKEKQHGTREKTPSSRHHLSVLVCDAHAWHVASRHG